MKKIRDAVLGIRTFLDEVRQELRKCAWPTRPELMDSTMVVIVSVTILAVFVGLSDALITAVLNVVIR